MTADDADRERPATRIPSGLCATCCFARVIRSDRGSIFIRCGLSDTDPRFVRYPCLPVAACPGYVPHNDE